MGVEAFNKHFHQRQKSPFTVNYLSCVAAKGIEVFADLGNVGLSGLFTLSFLIG